MACTSCNKTEEKDMIDEAVTSARIMSDMMEKYDRQNKRLWVTVLSLAGAFLISAACAVWAVVNAQQIANEAMLEALNSVAEIGVTQETTTTTTQTVEGDDATINNVDGDQYNDNAANYGGDE